MYKVYVDNIGWVWTGPNFIHAKIEAQQWVNAGKEPGSRAHPRSYIMKGDELVAEYSSPIVD